MRNEAHSSFCTLHFALCTRRMERGTALIETAIIMPLYMLILLGVIYFGNAGLSKQRQAKAGAYAAWVGVAQPADMLQAFWGSSQPADMTLALQVNTRQGDEYYAMEKYIDPITGAVRWIWPGDPNYVYPPISPNDNYHTVFIPSQLGANVYSLEAGGKDLSDVFDRERLAVELWNYALSHTTQSFTWVAGQQENRTWDTFSSYLNSGSPSAFNQGGGFVDAPAATNGWVPFGSESGAGQGPSIGPYQNMMTAVLNGPPGAQWLQRRTVVSQATYSPPFFPQIFADTEAPPTTFTNYISGNYPTPAFVPTATQRFDVTGRPDPYVFRYALGEGGQTPANMIGEDIPKLLGGIKKLDDPVDTNPQWVQEVMSSAIANGATVQDPWTPW